MFISTPFVSYWKPYLHNYHIHARLSYCKQAYNSSKHITYCKATENRHYFSIRIVFFSKNLTDLVSPNSGDSSFRFFNIGSGIFISCTVNIIYGTVGSSIALSFGEHCTRLIEKYASSQDINKTHSAKYRFTFFHFRPVLAKTKWKRETSLGQLICFELEAKRLVWSFLIVMWNDSAWRETFIDMTIHWFI